MTEYYTSPHLEQARRLLDESPLIDGHNDFPYMIRGLYKNHLDATNLQNLPIGQTDISRLLRGQVGGQFWSAYVPCLDVDVSNKDLNEEAKRDGKILLPDEKDLQAIHDTLQQIDLIQRMIDQYPTVFALAHTAADILPLFSSGRITSLIGVEGLHQIGNSVSVLRTFHRLGVRYVTLVHNKNNRFADSANAVSALHGGLSDMGRRVVREMNRIGLMIDLSHTTEAVQLQVLETSTAPVIFSHSSCYALCAHPRNVTDHVLVRLKTNGGILMICFLPELSRSPSSKASSLETVVDHIMYAVEKVGFEHVGIGSDFDGMLEGPRGVEDVTCYPALVAELLKRGMKEDHVKGVMGLNIIRVMAAVENVARQETRQQRQQQEGRVVTLLEDQISEIWTPEQKGMLREQGRKRGLVSD